MLIKVHTTRSFIALFLLFTFVSQTLPVKAQDLLSSEDLTAGTSVFIFRGSRKRPQERDGKVRLSASDAGFYKVGMNRQVASNRQKKAAQAKSRQAELARVRARERNAKLKLSNTLTARAETMMESGDIDGATNNFREAIKINPKNNDAKLGLSQALTAKGIEVAGDELNDDATAFFTEAVSLDQRNDVAFAKLGEIHDARGRTADAIVSYEKALEIDPEFSSLYLPLGVAYAEQDDVAKAETYLNKAAAIDSDSAKAARLTLAGIYRKQNKFDESLATLDALIKEDPNNAAAYALKGDVYMASNDESNAIASYRKAIDLDPNTADPHYDLGVIYYNKGDYASAEANYKEAVRIEPANYKAQANLASTYRQMERYADANAGYKLAEPGNTKNADFYSEWGFCLGKTNEWDKAVARLETARTLNPDAIDEANMGWAYYNRGQALSKEKKDDEAAEQFALSKASSQRAVELDPKLDGAYLNLGAANNSTGDYEAAKLALNTALARRSDWVPALNQLGQTHLGLKDAAGAVAQFNRVLNIDGNNVMGLYGLGTAEYSRGNKKEAKKAQDRLKKIDPKMAEQLGNVIAGKAIDAGVNEIRRRIRIPGF